MEDDFTEKDLVKTRPKKKKFYSKQGNLVKLRKSRGYYYCDECGDKIEPKDEYWDISGGDGYDGFHRRICKKCWGKSR